MYLKFLEFWYKNVFYLISFYLFHLFSIYFCKLVSLTNLPAIEFIILSFILIHYTSWSSILCVLCYSLISDILVGYPFFFNSIIFLLTYYLVVVLSQKILLFQNLLLKKAWFFVSFFIVSIASAFQSILVLLLINKVPYNIFLYQYFFTLLFCLIISATSNLYNYFFHRKSYRKIASLL